MDLIFQVFVAFFVAVGTYISYVWYSVRKTRRRLHWIPEIPGLPIIGNVLELADSSKSLDTFTKYVQQSDGLCKVKLVNRTVILSSNYTFLEFLLTTTKILDKSMDYKFLRRWLGSGLLTADAVHWKKKRKIITPTFHFSILEQFIDIFEDNGEIMVEQLQKEVDNDYVDIYPYVTLCVLDIICETAMGVSINAQTNKYSDYVLAVKEMCRITVGRSFSPIKMFDTIYPLTKDYYKEKKYVKTLHTYTTSVIASRKKELENKKSNNDKTENDLGVKKKNAFLDLLLQVTVEGEPLSDEEIREEVDTFMFEGHDTTASAIGFALYCLATNPDVQELAVEEQKQLFNNNPYRKASYRDLQDMKYLELVIKEALRLYPSVPFYARRTTEDVEYKDGLVIPKGVSLLIFAFGINRNAEFFPDPDKFDPNRFQNLDGKSPYAYLPFSAGPRNCIGQKFAILEMKSTISKLLRNFEIYADPQGPKLVLLAETVLKSANGIPVKLKRRKW